MLAAMGPAGAQQTEQELIQHLDTLVPLLKDARRRAAVAQAAARRARDVHIPLDTVSIGLLTVLVVPGEGGVAQEVVGGVWKSDYAPWLSASPALAADRMFFQWSRDVVAYNSSEFTVRIVQGARWHPRSYMETGVREVISQSLKGDLVATRVGAEWTVSAVKPPDDPERIYRQVALAPSHAAQACLAGEPTSCLTAFGLLPSEGLLEDRYTPEERLLLVRQNASRFVRGAPLELRSCSSGDLAQCDRLLADFLDRYTSAQNRLWTVPFGVDVRASLLWFALVRGGEGSWGRLLAHADDAPLVALEAASSLQGEALMQEWHDWLLASRPVRHAGLGTQVLTASLWILLLLALAARSTRWRFA